MIKDAVMEQIVKGIRQRVPVEEYANKGYSAEQMREIRIGMVKGISYNLYAAPYISPKAMRQWRLALQKGISDKTLCDYIGIEGKNYTAEQIKEIRLGLQNKQDVRLFGNPDLSAAQMHEIRLAQKDGLNAQLFASTDYSAAQMKQLRTEMLLVKIIDLIKSLFSKLFNNISAAIKKAGIDNDKTENEKISELFSSKYTKLLNEHNEQAFDELSLDEKVDMIINEFERETGLAIDNNENTYYFANITDEQLTVLQNSSLPYIYQKSNSTSGISDDGNIIVRVDYKDKAKLIELLENKKLTK